MKTKRHTIDREEWEFALWFAIFSPLIGIALGVVALFLFAR